MANLTTNFNLGNGARLVFGPFVFDDDNGVVTVDVDLRTAIGGTQPDASLCKFTSVVRNGTCTVHDRVASPPAGLPIHHQGRYITESTRTVAAGYDNAKSAERAAANAKAARRAALEAHWLAAGHIAAGLAYT